ncbi:hypothetical protein EC915_102344 [Pseudomonas sp. LP_7_YM]|nr:hypothetical protein EC915_102344 [Pseudomonas sp. LP_7_YM]
MRPEIAVLDLQGQFRVYTESYRTDAAEKTIVMVNGSLATTASANTCHRCSSASTTSTSALWTCTNTRKCTTTSAMC